MVFFTEEFDFEKKEKRISQRSPPMKWIELSISLHQKHHETTTETARHTPHSDNTTAESGVCALSNEIEWNGRSKRGWGTEVIMGDFYEGNNLQEDKMEIDWMEMTMNRVDRLKPDTRRESISLCTRSSSRQSSRCSALVP